jgi:hypothetical protein
MMKHGRTPPRGSALAMLLLVLAVSVPAQAQDLPDAAVLLARYHEAMGGASALDGKTTVRSTGQFAMPAAGMVADFEAYAARPNRSAMRVTIPGFGELRSGYTGAVGWSMNPAEGPRLLQGAEARQTADEADFESMLRLPASIASMQTVERTSLAGRDCYRVRLIWKSGRETADCYSPDTGLLVGTTRRHESNMGTVDAVLLYDDYRMIDGVMMAGRITVQMMGVEQIFTFSDVHFNVDADAGLAPPAEIQALIDG